MKTLIDLLEDLMKGYGTDWKVIWKGDVPDAEGELMYYPEEADWARRYRRDKPVPMTISIFKYTEKEYYYKVEYSHYTGYFRCLGCRMQLGGWMFSMQSLDRNPRLFAPEMGGAKGKNGALAACMVNAKNHTVMCNHLGDDVNSFLWSDEAGTHYA